ncbi:MAG: pitrilysin family protein [Acholeplasmatales bacterium]|jgi:predicted Zn-dependent peptidase|nr:insulinase family protein [Acholeplasmataceae bacterium]MDY0115286.1 pitrilysin family protein [Acholeplasmatales bacterium]MCK9233847.1 insulinase family protein [Acholeplasmataceae bacterium]MCK9289221.1 insulinase family protein [Acholeplasmataceae bacterium]MCK9427673.1 insulinase family protein [Acholeplasmataceae bacterium]
MIIDKQKKFKTSYLGIKFKEEIKKEHIGFRALLPNLLKTRTKTYPTRKLLQEALDDLYGASLVAKVTKKGNLSILEFGISFINPDFTDEPLFEKVVALLQEIIYQSNVPKKDFVIEKRMLLEKIRALKNDKTRFALQRMSEEMFKNETYGLQVSGKEEDVLALSYQKVNNYYQKMLKTNSLDVVFSGDLNEEEMALLKETFQEDNNELEVIDFQNKEVLEPKTIVETDTISQSKVNLGYRLPIRANDKLYHAAVVFNTALGGGIHSRLFLNVREKHSLCYYISSQYDPFKGFMFIYSGIDKDRVDLALKVIDEQLLDLQTNKLKEAELNLSKQTLINRFKELEDAQNQSLEALYTRHLLNNKKTLEERIAKIESVTSAEVVEVANLVKKDILYILAPEDNK